MDDDECRRRFGSADHAYLATVRSDGAPQLLPVGFDLTDDQVAVVVDHKPKRTTALRRLRNIGQNPRVCLLADAYSADWDALWWVRADGSAVVVDGGRAHENAIRLLVQRYPQYVDEPPVGPVILITIDRWTGWSAR